MRHRATDPDASVNEIPEVVMSSTSNAPTVVLVHEAFAADPPAEEQLVP